MDFPNSTRRSLSFPACGASQGPEEAGTKNRQHFPWWGVGGDFLHSVELGLGGLDAPSDMGLLWEGWGGGRVG